MVHFWVITVVHFSIVISTCIADGFNSKKVIQEASAAAREYLEPGGLSIEAYTEATIPGREFLKKRYNSKFGFDLTIMKCIDFFHSKELDQIIEKHK